MWLCSAQLVYIYLSKASGYNKDYYNYLQQRTGLQRRCTAGILPETIHSCSLLSFSFSPRVLASVWDIFFSKIKKDHGSYRMDGLHYEYQTILKSKPLSGSILQDVYQKFMSCAKMETPYCYICKFKSSPDTHI